MGRTSLSEKGSPQCRKRATRKQQGYLATAIPRTLAVPSPNSENHLFSTRGAPIQPGPHRLHGCAQLRVKNHFLMSKSQKVQKRESEKSEERKAIKTTTFISRKPSRKPSRKQAFGASIGGNWKLQILSYYYSKKYPLFYLIFFSNS